MRSLVVLEDGHLDLRRRGTAHVEESAQFVVDDEAGRLYRCTTSSEDGCSSVHCHSAQSGEVRPAACTAALSIGLLAEPC